MRSAAPTRDDLACVLLAAGGSRRLGRPKQLLRLRTRPLLLHAVTTARAALPNAPLIVVLGAETRRLRLLLRRSAPHASIVTNPDWHRGMALSLRAGLDAAPPSARAALVLLVDQPRISPGALRRLVAAWRRRPAAPAAAFYGGRSGVPAVLPRACWRALRTLHGDEGARALLRHGARPTLVDLPEAALDIDTPEDLLEATRGLSTHVGGHNE